MKIITFTVPCYNSAAYMDKCLETLLSGGEDVEIIIVDDGSTDDTGKIADSYASHYPSIVKAIHQENGGHGEGVNAGIRCAQGLYFKVVDSDDWLNVQGLKEVLNELKKLVSQGSAPDLMVCNYVYEHSKDDTQYIVNYKNVFPQNYIFNWCDIGSFKASQYLMMHSLIFLTGILRACRLILPKHTFYVDNIFAFKPLPYVRTLYYMDIDLYRYFIGRSDQSVNEQVLMKRLDQQVSVNKTMIDCYPIDNEGLDKKLINYLTRNLSMMLLISSVFLQISGTEESLTAKDELWQYLKKRDLDLYYKLRYRIFGTFSNLPGNTGRKITKQLYRLTRKIYKFN
jgi:Glycosyltransferases involved in cell wall biogenesis